MRILIIILLSFGFTQMGKSEDISVSERRAKKISDIEEWLFMRPTSQRGLPVSVEESELVIDYCIEKYIRLQGVFILKEVDQLIKDFKILRTGNIDQINNALRRIMSHGPKVSEYIPTSALDDGQVHPHVLTEGVKALIEKDNFLKGRIKGLHYFIIKFLIDSDSDSTFRKHKEHAFEFPLSKTETDKLNPLLEGYIRWAFKNNKEDKLSELSVLLDGKDEKVAVKVIDVLFSNKPKNGIPNIFFTVLESKYQKVIEKSLAYLNQNLGAMPMGLPPTSLIKLKGSPSSFIRNRTNVLLFKCYDDVDSLKNLISEAKKSTRDYFTIIHRGLMSMDKSKNIPEELSEYLFEQLNQGNSQEKFNAFDILKSYNGEVVTEGMIASLNDEDLFSKACKELEGHPDPAFILSKIETNKSLEKEKAFQNLLVKLKRRVRNGDSVDGKLSYKYKSLDAVLGVGLSIFTRHGGVGVKNLSPLYGFKISSIFPNSLAKTSSLKVNDIIWEIQGNRILSHADLWKALIGKTPGEIVTLKVFRSDKGFFETRCELANVPKGVNALLFDQEKEISRRIKTIIPMAKRNVLDLDELWYRPEELDHQISILSVEGLNSMLWEMHLEKYYFPGWKKIYDYLNQKIENNISILDTLAWVMVDNNQPDIGLNIYKERILPLIKTDHFSYMKLEVERDYEKIKSFVEANLEKNKP